MYEPRPSDLILPPTEPIYILLPQAGSQAEPRLALDPLKGA